MNMHNPPHPGEIIKEMYLEPLGLSVTATAKALNVTRQTVSELINQKTGISIEMAMRLSKAFKTTPGFWINMQTQYDLWHARNKKLGRVQCLVDRKT